ncbi:Aste57867_8491 [Aphanomyces stellatus]|uniref:Aste57867_8491 protein n=1 Tax=Aphanomyces stellatus TaxID=120398 RepID=A0A485KKJ6_9STRA|nr:hypothetical protein As57867_008459 [Aphanomyces stellatus]VFT85377.1 Aste57867_8491 [Aphanomyces stellatus]
MKVKRLKLPLPRTFFRCPPLSESTRLSYIHQGQKALSDLVQKTRLHGGTIEWTFDHESSGVAVYRGLDVDHHMPLFLRIAEVQGTLSEAANLMGVGADGSDDFCLKYHPEDVKDLQTLYTLATPTPSHPHNSIVVKWRAVDGTFRSTRDMVYVEYQDDFTIDGVDGFGRCLQSVEMAAACPNLERSFGLVRADIQLGGDIFLNSRRDGYITVCRLYQVDLRGNVPSWANALLTKSEQTKRVQAIDHHLRQQRINHTAFLPEYTLVPRHTRSHCARCRAKFAPLAKKFNCRKCGDVVCKRCHQPWDVQDTTLSILGRGKPQMFRVCTECSSTPLPPSLMTLKGRLSDTASDVSSSWQVDPPPPISYKPRDMLRPQLVSLSYQPDYRQSMHAANPCYPLFYHDSPAMYEDIPIMMSTRADMLLMTKTDLIPILASARHDQYVDTTHHVKAHHVRLSIDNDDVASTSATADLEDWTYDMPLPPMLS